MDPKSQQASSPRMSEGDLALAMVKFVKARVDEDTAT